MQAHAERLRSAAQNTRNKALQAAICAGIGFHNGSMEGDDRLLVEGLFLAQDIPVGGETDLSSRHGCRIILYTDGCCDPLEGLYFLHVEGLFLAQDIPTGVCSYLITIHHCMACAGPVHHIDACAGRQPACPPGGHQGHTQVGKPAHV